VRGDSLLAALMTIDMNGPDIDATIEAVTDEVRLLEGH
jgi:hypothetical protein